MIDYDAYLKKYRRLTWAAVALMTICLLMIGLILADQYQKWAYAERVADQVLRFHVIANSDSEEDQALKLEVRDALVTYMADNHHAFGSAEDAAVFAQSHCAELTAIAADVIRQRGFSYDVTAAVSLCSFPEKTYGNFTFPAGTYEALQVRIGEAAGQNWWCVLYPLLCFTEEGVASFPTESQSQLKEVLSEADYQRLQQSTGSSGKNPTASVRQQEPVIRVWIWDKILSLFDR